MLIDVHFYLTMKLFFFLFYIFFRNVNRANIKDDGKSLIIKNVIPDDEGIYICEANNNVGQISAKAQLVVNCKYQFCFFCH